MDSIVVAGSPTPTRSHRACVLRFVELCPFGAMSRSPDALGRPALPWPTAVPQRVDRPTLSIRAGRFRLRGVTELVSIARELLIARTVPITPLSEPARWLDAITSARQEARRDQERERCVMGARLHRETLHGDERSSASIRLGSTPKGSRSAGVFTDHFIGASGKYKVAASARVQRSSVRRGPRARA